MDDLTSKYLDFWEDVMSRTLLNPDLQEKFVNLCHETMQTLTQGTSNSDGSQ